MSKRTHVIFNFLDSPLKILLWTKGEWSLIFGPFLLGVVLNTFFLGVLCSLISIFVIRFFKKHFGKGQLQAVMYWYLPPTSKLKFLPLSYKKEYLG
jgi:type IV conjugative transfer system protein TraL